MTKLKKPEEYLNEVNSLTTKERLNEIGRQMQIDAYNQALEDAVENAEVEYKEDGFMRYGDMKWIDTSSSRLNDDSVLKLKLYQQKRWEDLSK